MTTNQQNREELKNELTKFEDDLLNKSIDNERGLLVCEINVFRKCAYQALQSTSQSAAKEAREHTINQVIEYMESEAGNDGSQAIIEYLYWLKNI